MSSLWATVHHGIEDLRIHPCHPAYNRCLHWRVAWDMRCTRSLDNQMPNVDLRGTALPLTRIADSVLKHVPAGITPGSSASAVESLVICRVVAKDRSLPYLLNRGLAPTIWQPVYMRWKQQSGKLSVDRDITPTGLYALHSAPLSSSYITSTSSAQSPDIDIIPIQRQSNTCTETCASFTDRQESQEVLSPDAEEQQSCDVWRWQGGRMKCV